MPTVKVVTYPKCETLVAHVDKWSSHVLAKQRVRYERCNCDGALYLIVGDLGTVEQALCVPHRRQVQKDHPEWGVFELKGKGVRVEERVAAETPVAQPIADEDIPF